MVALAAILVAGCADEGSSDEPPPAPSRASYVRTVNGICASSEHLIHQASARVNPLDPNDEELIDSVSAEFFVDPVQDEIDAIIRLRPPIGDEPRIDAILSQLQLINDQVRGSPRVLRTLSPRQVRRIRKLFTGANQLTAEYGLRHCCIRTDDPGSTP